MVESQTLLWCLCYFKINKQKTSLHNRVVFRNTVGQQSHITSRTEEKNETGRDPFN